MPEPRRTLAAAVLGVAAVLAVVLALATSVWSLAPVPALVVASYAVGQHMSLDRVLGAVDDGTGAGPSPFRF